MAISKDKLVRERRETLTEAVVVDAALALVEREGAERLTFRRLGEALGSAPTAVLRHVRDKDDLLLAIGDRLLSDVVAAFRKDPDGQEDAPWRTRIECMGRCLREAFLAHPRVSVLVSAKTLSRPSEFMAAEILIRALLDAGLPTREAASAYRVIADTMLAWAAFEANVRAIEMDGADENEIAWAVRYPALPARTYPSIHAVAHHLTSVDHEDQYSLALGFLLDGIVTLAPGHRCQRELRRDKLEVPCKTAQLKTFFSCTEEKVFCTCLTT